MVRPLRIQFPGAIYQVMVQGNERRRIFKDDRDRRRLLDQLAQAATLDGAGDCFLGSDTTCGADAAEGGAGAGA